MDLAKTTFDSAVTNDHPFFKNLQRCVMTPLQEQVLARDTCPSCHTKRLHDGYSGGGMRFKHCACGHTWVTPNALAEGPARLLAQVPSSDVLAPKVTTE